MTATTSGRVRQFAESLASELFRAAGDAAARADFGEPAECDASPQPRADAVTIRL
jgi:hypothetical protein